MSLTRLVIYVTTGYLSRNEFRLMGVRLGLTQEQLAEQLKTSAA